MSTTEADAPFTPPPDAPRTSVWHRLYHGETTFDFIGRRKIGFAISGVLLLLTIGSLFTRGLNLGLDFKGGVAWEAHMGGFFAGLVGVYAVALRWVLRHRNPALIVT